MKQARTNTYIAKDYLEPKSIKELSDQFYQFKMKRKEEKQNIL